MGPLLVPPGRVRTVPVSWGGKAETFFIATFHMTYFSRWCPTLNVDFFFGDCYADKILKMHHLSNEKYEAISNLLLNSTD